MEGYGLILPLLGLVAATVFLATRPARGPGSVAASSCLQAGLLAVSLVWGVVSGLVALVSLGLAMWNRDPPFWPSFAVGIAVVGLCIAWLGRPWGPAGDMARVEVDDVASAASDGE